MVNKNVKILLKNRELPLKILTVSNDRKDSLL